MRLSDTARSRKVLSDVDGSVRPAVDRAIEQFVTDHTVSSLNFERIVGYENSYSIRASRTVRILLRRVDSDLFEIRAIGNHEVYRRR